MKKILSIALVVVLLAGIAVSGTMAYLTDTDSAVNVMTLGNVKIEQSEYERVVGENGDFVTVDTSNVDPNYGYNQAYELQEFTQGKPAYPAVYTNGSMDWDEFQQLWNQVGAPGSNDLFDDSMKNVIDKFVFVENTGKSDAYYRTIIAIEAPEGLDDEKMIHTSFNANSRFDYNVDVEGAQTAKDANEFYATIDGVRYLVYVATYTEALTPDEVSRPSLLQLFLDPEATNDDCALFGDTWEVLVLSQAVQTAGFDSAAEALNAGFDEVNAANVAEWFGGVLEGDDWDGTVDENWKEENESAATNEYVINNAEELAAFAAAVNGGDTFAGKTVKLAANIDLQNKDWTPIADYSKSEDGVTFKGTFDGQGYTVSNLYINRGNDEDSWEVGLFGRMVGATIKNVNIKNVEISNGYSHVGAIVGNSYTGTVSNCNVSGDIKILGYAYVGGITGGGYATIKDCSVIGNAGSYVKTYGTHSFAGGIVGKHDEGNIEISNCVVKNLDLSAYGSIGAIAGFIHYGNKLDGCVAENITLTKIRTDGCPSIGLAIGCWSYNASKPITITNNKFTNITINGTAVAYSVDAGDIELHGSEYGGASTTNFVLDNNVKTNITNNLTTVTP